MRYVIALLSILIDIFSFIYLYIYASVITLDTLVLFSLSSLILIGLLLLKDMFNYFKINEQFFFLSIDTLLFIFSNLLIIFFILIFFPKINLILISLLNVSFSITRVFKKLLKYLYQLND